MKQKDILLPARPDQSLDIYRSLCKQNKLSFEMITFKVVRPWVKKIIPYKKLVTVGKNCTILLWGTFVHVSIFNFKFKFAKKWNDTKILNPSIVKHISNTKYKIIHYWPENGGEPLKKFNGQGNDTFVIADIHMPHPRVVYQEMLPIYEKYGIDPTTLKLYKLIKDEGDLLSCCNNALVPSTYVADTYKQIYKDKHYYVVPYGIMISPLYKKTYRKEIKNFIYAGGITLEKGCDVLLEYFLLHPQINIHLFGSISRAQKDIFSKYMDTKNIIFHGLVAKSELQRIYQKYDAGIHLSRFDAYSIAVGEVIGAGKPVIVSDKTGNADDVLNYGFGYVSEVTIESLDYSIKKLCITNNYNSLIDNIDAYISSKRLNYGDTMIQFYTDIIAGNYRNITIV